MTLTLQRGDVSLILEPNKGGSVAALKFKGDDILHPARPAFSQDNWTALDSAGFPMVPFVGRIQNGVFKDKNEVVHLSANMPPEPHAIHGFGWQAPWQVHEQSDSHAALRHTYSGSEWPWAYQAEQVFYLRETGLSLSMRLTNQSKSAMPGGFGWHPYFTKAGATLRAPVTEAWTGQNKPPEKTALHEKTDLSSGHGVETLDLDHAFDISEPDAIIETPKYRLRLESDAIFSKVTVFTPPTEAFFCVEPITHAPDAVNMTLAKAETGLTRLEPGETLSGEIRLSIDPLN